MTGSTGLTQQIETRLEKGCAFRLTTDMQARTQTSSMLADPGQRSPYAEWMM